MKLKVNKTFYTVTVFVLLLSGFISFKIAAQTNELREHKTDVTVTDTNKETISKSVANSLLSSIPQSTAGTIISTNNGVTITQGPGATAVPEGPEPQGGWFAPLYTAEGMITPGSIPFSVSIGNDGCFHFLYISKNLNVVNSMLVTSDNTNVYSILYTKVVDESEHKQDISSNKQFESVSISKGPVPYLCENICGALWMSFMSGEYLCKEEKQHIPDILGGMQRLEPASWSVDLKFSLLDNSSNVITSTGSFVIAKKYILERVIDYPIDEPDDLFTSFVTQNFNALHQSAVDGECLSKYELEKSLLVNGLTIPISFLVHAYIFNVPTNINRLKSEFKGVVTNIITHPQKIALLPQIKGDILVLDERFRYRTNNVYRDAITYHCTNGWILDTNDPIIGSVSKALFLHNEKANRYETFYFIVITLVVLIFLPLFFLFCKTRKHD